MNDLNSIGDVLEKIDTLKYSSAKTALLYQVLQAHSSAIPLSAMVVFVYSTLESDDSQQEQKVVDFLEFLVKICYAHDPAQDIKYKIFDINVKIMNKRQMILQNGELSDDFLMKDDA